MVEFKMQEEEVTPEEEKTEEAPAEGEEALEETSAE